MTPMLKAGALIGIALMSVWRFASGRMSRRSRPATQVAVAIAGLGFKQGTAKLRHFRIDSEHSNAYTAWQRMGSPQKPSVAQYAQLEKASELAMLSGSSVTVADGRCTLEITLPRQAVSLLVLEW